MTYVFEPIPRCQFLFSLYSLFAEHQCSSGTSPCVNNSSKQSVHSTLIPYSAPSPPSPTTCLSNIRREPNLSDTPIRFPLKLRSIPALANASISETCTHRARGPTYQDCFSVPTILFDFCLEVLTSASAKRIELDLTYIFNRPASGLSQNQRQVRVKNDKTGVAPKD